MGFGGIMAMSDVDYSFQSVYKVMCRVVFAFLVILNSDMLVSSLCFGSLEVQCCHHRYVSNSTVVWQPIFKLPFVRPRPLANSLVL